MMQHAFTTPIVTELPDPRARRAHPRHTIHSPLDGPPDDWATFPPVQPH